MIDTQSLVIDTGMKPTKCQPLCTQPLCIQPYSCLCMHASLRCSSSQYPVSICSAPTSQPAHSAFMRTLSAPASKCSALQHAPLHIQTIQCCQTQHCCMHHANLSKKPKRSVRPILLKTSQYVVLPMRNAAAHHPQSLRKGEVAFNPSKQVR